MRTEWNEGWTFAKLPLESTYEELRHAAMTPVRLPHDALISDAEHLYEDCDLWYRKTLHTFSPADGDRVFLSFDGVYMDADILLNGQVARTHRYGYTAFRVPLEGLMKGENEIAVHIRHRSPNSRWYSGAGIFRDVFLETLPRDHMIPDGFQVNTAREGDRWRLDYQMEMSGGAPRPRVRLLGPGGACLAEGAADVPRGSLLVRAEPWSPASPVMYRLVFTLPGQEEVIPVGFRETRFDPDRGFFLNGEMVKLHGVCLHHDLGALGAAFNACAAGRQLRLMKDMGVNAIRTSHNPPARAFLDLCDKMGLMVIDECYDMWEMSKTAYDNARFFPDTYPETVAEWVRRDRCHPSVIMWSIGNEIYDMQASEKGRYWTKTLMDEVRRHDDRHAPVTFGCNYMPWENAQKCADVVKIPGYNYAEKYYAEHHREHPDWVIYGSETASLVMSRGIYHFPMDQEIMSEEDLQCSALMNSNTSWGARDLRKMLAEDLRTPYSMGQFIWSGTDYIGEPTPYHTRSSYFGQADTAGFPKDSYYFYQAMWTDAPMIHIGVSWDFNPGQMIDVPVMTNCAGAELLLNGRSLGKKAVDRLSAGACLPVWRVPFEKGVLEARGLDEKGNMVLSARKETPGDPYRLKIRASESAVAGGAGRIVFCEVTALDKRGVPVENACDYVTAGVTGRGVLLGMDNGDSADRDGYKVSGRCLFSGSLLVMAGAQRGGGVMTVSVSAPGLIGDAVTVAVTPGGEKDFDALCAPAVPEENVYIRKIALEPLGPTLLSPGRDSVTFLVRALPARAMPQEIAFRVVNAQGVEVPCGRITRDGDRVTVTAVGDGSMYLRAAANNTYPHPRVLSQIEITASGFGAPGLDPYGFIAGALCDIRIGDIGAGNEKGIAFARDGKSAAGFSHVDFGPVGSDTLTLPVFALDSARHVIGLWDGVPGEGGRKIADLVYEKKSIWNVYQEETYRLPEVLTGEHTLTFSMNEKIHLKGFSFRRQSRAGRTLRPGEADRITGDSFRVDGGAVRDIGNNVTIAFGHMRFDKAGPLTLSLKGFTPLEENAVQVRVTAPDGTQCTTLCPFRHSEGVSEQEFQVTVPEGECETAFVFLPGSRFDFEAFRFILPDGDDDRAERKD